MKNLKTFSEFISEATEFNPANTSDIDVLLPAIKSASELKPGKEYVVKLNGKTHANMMYQGVSDGNYIFNSEDMETVLNLNREQINGAVSTGGVQPVNEAMDKSLIDKAIKISGEITLDDLAGSNNFEFVANIFGKEYKDIYAIDSSNTDSDISNSERNTLKKLESEVLKNGKDLAAAPGIKIAKRLGNVILTNSGISGEGYFTYVIKESINEAVKRTAAQVNKDAEDRIKNQIARYSELMKTKPEKANYYKAQLDLAHARATTINLKKKVDALKESTGLNEAKSYKGREIFPDWIDPKRDFGAPVKSLKDLKPGAEYILWEPGMDTWQAEFIYQGNTGGKYIFNDSNKEADPMIFTASEIGEYISNGDVIKQN